MWLTRFAVRQPTIVTLFFLAVALFGAIGYASMGKNIIPNISLPVVTVSAAYPGASPEEIERLVVRPIEDQIQTIRHLDKVNATAVDGAATIVVQFKLGTDIDASANDVTQAVNAARINLPSDLDPPVIDKIDISAQPILSESITSKSREAGRTLQPRRQRDRAVAQRREGRRQRPRRRRLPAPVLRRTRPGQADRSRT